MVANNDKFAEVNAQAVAADHLHVLPRTHVLGFIYINWRCQATTCSRLSSKLYNIYLTTCVNVGDAAGLSRLE